MARAMALTSAELNNEKFYAADPEETPERYLEIAAKCSERAKSLTSPKFNEEQCKYLVGKLTRTLEGAHLFLKKFKIRCNDELRSLSKNQILPKIRSIDEDRAKHVQVFKFLLALAMEVEAFIQGCCKDEWVQAAVILACVSEHIISIGFNLELCRVVFFNPNRCGGAGSCRTSADIEDAIKAEVQEIFEAEEETVRVGASLDKQTLLEKLTQALHSKKKKTKNDHELVGFLFKRLNREISIAASDSGVSSQVPVSLQQVESVEPDILDGVEELGTLGSSSSAKVFKANWLGIQVAKKTFFSPGDPQFKKEVQILEQLSHPYIMSLFGSGKDKRNLSIIMELMEKDLYDLLQQNCDGLNECNPFTFLEAVEIIHQLAAGMNYLHENKIVHRDLKSFNILVKCVKTTECLRNVAYVHAKVADFGIAKLKVNSGTYSEQEPNTGTNRWMAPELIKLPTFQWFGCLQSLFQNFILKHPYKCDVYSFAMVCYEILAGNVPFVTINKSVDVKKRVLEGLRPPLSFDQCPEKLKKLIERCWDKNPNKRPTFAEICAELKYMKYHLMTSLVEDSQMTNGASSSGYARHYSLESKHKVYLSHSGVQNCFVEQLCVNLEKLDRYPFFDQSRDSLPIRDHSLDLVSQAIRQCQVGVVILSEEFFTRTKWPMLELVTMVKLKMQNPNLRIILVFLGISLLEICDGANRKRWKSKWRCWGVDIGEWEKALLELFGPTTSFFSNGIFGEVGFCNVMVGILCKTAHLIQYQANRKRWQSKWLGWAQCDSRIDVQVPKTEVEPFGPTISLSYNGDLGEVRFQEEIVETICKLVRPETWWDDSFVQGKFRLCETIRNKIDSTKVSRSYGVRVVGLYGVGGTGKTTMCKVLCNEMFTEFQGAVCHLELESVREVELMRKLLGRLTHTRNALLNGFDKDECYDLVRTNMHKQKVFLAIDKMADNEKAIDLAKTYLEAGYKHGSIVLVVARSLSQLQVLNIHENDCVEMPQLNDDESRSLLLQHEGFHPMNESDEELITHCIQECRFSLQGYDKNPSSHYHPLALKLLGVQLGNDRRHMVMWLDELDTMKRLQAMEPPSFTLLRKKSFKALKNEDKLLFLDVALFFPENSGSERKLWKGLDLIRWLSMVHGTSEDSIKTRLKSLKRKSLIEAEDGITRIGVHDLWREFAVWETEHQRRRPWVHVDLERFSGTPSCDYWEDLQRIGLKGSPSWSSIVEKVNLSACSNLEVLKIVDCHLEDQLLDLRALENLKSLEIFSDTKYLFTKDFPVNVLGLSSLNNLTVLRWDNLPRQSPSCIEEIGSLTSLTLLDLRSCERLTKLPDFSNLASLEALTLRFIDGPETLEGLSSRMTSLRFLDLTNCWALRSLPPGVGDLVALEELQLFGCRNLQALPSLAKLKNLRRLDITGCDLITALPEGLRALVSLEELRAGHCSGSVELADMRKLTKLQVLDIEFGDSTSLVWPDDRTISETT